MLLKNMEDTKFCFIEVEQPPYTLKKVQKYYVEKC